MNIQAAIKSRRSVRQFKEKKIPKEIIKKLIESATDAPSACNRQPWIFYCVESEKKRTEIISLLHQVFNLTLKKQLDKKSRRSQEIGKDFYKNFGDAPMIIFIFRKISDNEATHVEPNDIKSISCAAQNLTLAAVENGLGTCWIGSFDGPETQKELKNILKVPEEEKLVASIVIGYPKENYKPVEVTKKKLNEITKFI